jgi:coatomer subunit gamma
MIYLSIKEMSTVANDVIIVTSSLTRDMTGKEDSHRGPAIRALCKITDVRFLSCVTLVLCTVRFRCRQASMMQSVERYMKQAIVDKLASVSSAALTSSVHLMRHGPEVVKRWVNEVQEAVNNENIMVQYHALGLLYQIRRLDKHAIRKLILKFAKAGLRSPYAYCFLVRCRRDIVRRSETCRLTCRV